jgi:hypothetical protein
MTESNRALQEVGALAAERRKYEGWIAALDGRRESTPAHVFERVMRDYRERLDRVKAQLSSHQSALEEERASLASRLALLEGEEQLRRDERAELELRAHVGELTPQEVSSALENLDSTLQQLAGERETLKRSMDGLRELLAPDHPDQGDGALETGQTDGNLPDQGDGALEIGQNDSNQVLRPLDSGEEPVAAAPEASATQQDADSGPSAPGADVVKENTAEVSLLEDLLDPSATAGVRAEAPLAANVPANTPIVLRPSGGIEHAKTLKCQECGAMNYPTEWYCERCGAELAAL